MRRSNFIVTNLAEITIVSGEANAVQKGEFDCFTYVGPPYELATMRPGAIPTK